MQGKTQELVMSLEGRIKKFLTKHTYKQITGNNEEQNLSEGLKNVAIFAIPERKSCMFIIKGIEERLINRRYQFYLMKNIRIYGYCVATVIKSCICIRWNGFYYRCQLN
jgi:hypothetical protein